AHHVPVLLHEEHARARGIHGNVVNAVADLGSRVRDELGLQSTVDRPPRLAGIVGAKGARRRDGDEDPSGVARIENDRVQAHPAGARLPFGTRAVTAQAGEFLPALATVARAEQGGVLDPGVDGIRIFQRGFEMPHSLELPRVLRAVVKLVRGEGLAGFGSCVVNEFVALAHGEALWARCYPASGRLPGLAAVARALDHLPGPTTRLRGIQAIRVSWRPLHVIDLQARRLRTADRPLLALAISLQDKCALACTHQNPYSAHPFLLLEFP